MQNVEEPRHYVHQRLETPPLTVPMPFSNRLAVQALVEIMGARGLVCSAHDRIAIVAIAQNKPARRRDWETFWRGLERDASLGLEIVKAFGIRPDEGAIARLIHTVVPVRSDAGRTLTPELLANKAIAKQVLRPLDDVVTRYLALRQALIWNAAPEETGNVREG